MATKKAKPNSKVATPKPAPIEDTPYKIETGVPIEGVRTITNFNKFPFEQMKIGDSFLIPPGDKFSENPNSIHYAANRYAKLKPGFTVTTRLQLNKYRRVWRIK